MREVFEGIKEFWKEFRRIKSGVVGLILLIIFVLIVIFEPLLLAYPETNERWNDITYWQDLPMNAPPVWAARGYPASETLKPVDFSTEGTYLDSLDFVYNFDYSAPPDDLIIALDYPVPPSTFLSISIEIPGKGKITIPSKQLPYGTSLRIPVARDSDFRNAMRAIDPSKNQMDALFSQKGEYRINFLFVHNDAEFHEALKDMRINVLGKAHGLLGTDAYRRDLWSGVVAGVKWALIIGVVTAVITVLIGVFFGITSAYFGGWIDAFMQRVYEVVVSMPLFPLMIVIAAIYESSIWLIILLMCLFFWAGIQKTVRAIGLQIKEETFIEASEGFGASSRWILLKHMFPLLLPYALAEMALMVPGAIVYEASLSLIGLGDSTIVTWGQILGAAQTSGAVINNLWWWVLPPGIAIVLVGMSFAFIGFALDTVVAPRLRTL
ncbi:MAG: ABC transporter permease [Candidatus Thermoplasmatota archaeon]|nr:ABC transporter permease [Candidatus Thermoplasmatota archaeon]